ncbi:MAG: hypothetical protein J5944_09615 [Lentisphaeria bacterium]|nr:hypothetical protein [Lentisphaeria bacterium]
MSSNNENRGGRQGRRPPFALFIWLLIFLTGASLFIFQYDPAMSGREELTPAEFERNLTEGTILSADVMPESDKILYIEGKFEPKAAPEDGKVTDLTVAGGQGEARR